MQPEQKPQMQATLTVPQPVDPEGKMAKAELYRAAKMAMKLFQMIQDGQQLEGWVQAKITKSADYLDSIYHYMEYQVKFGSGAQAASVDDITGDVQIAAKDTKSEEDDEEMAESRSYEQRLQALLESAVKKVKEAAKPDYIDLDKDGNKKEPMKKAAKDKVAKEGFDSSAKVGDKFKTAKGTATKTKTGLVHTRDKYDYDPGSDDKDDKKAKRVAKKVKEASTGDYSAKKARAGKDIGKPGKQFSKIAKSAGEKYGSKERGEKVAGAVLAKLRKG